MLRQKEQLWGLSFLLLFFLFIFQGLQATNEIGDKNITNAVDKELMYNASTPSYLIDVETNEGIVTLSGSVGSILEKDRAVKIARTVKGVRGVINRIRVDAPFRKAVVLERDVTDALLDDPATDSYELSVEANVGVVTLEGSVESWQEKQIAAFVAKGVRGVKQLNNNIEIEYETDRTDFEIKEDVQQILSNDIRIDDALIEAEVNEGNVRLSGVVGSANEKHLALANSWVMGVNSVNADNLEVKSWAREDNLRENKYVAKTDAEVKEAVKDAFTYDPRVHSFNPEVSVEYGIVTLTGAVNNLKAKKAAEQDARNVVGVFGVNNHLKVRPVYIPEDGELESTVVTSLQQDPIVEKQEIDVSADNGVVFLKGSVDSYFEKAQATDIVSKIKGVVAVENNIDVNDTNDHRFSNYYAWNTYYPPYHVDVSDHYETDSEIKNNIESQLWWSPYVNEDEVEVYVSGRTAVLEGTVDTEREKLFAEINAIEGGAKVVENNLIVLYTPGN